METPGIITGRNDATHYWHIGDYFLIALPTPHGWDTRVRCRDWGATEFVLDGHFASEAEATAWCARMASVFARDQGDD